MSEEYLFEWESPAYVMMSSDYSQQEPKITSFVSQDSSMIKAFQEGKDIYASIASVSFKVPYEECLEFHPVTHEYQKEGKKRRSEAKTILLGVTYGRSIPSIADQLYGTRDDMTQEEKVSAAQEVYDAVMNGFPAIRKAMLNAQGQARDHGFIETILGRRRHLPDMTLPEFEFKAMPGYVNPDIDPLDPSTLDKRSDIPDRIVKQLTEEFSKLKYYGQIVKRSKQLEEEHIRVINNRPKITDATRQCLNCVDFETEILTLQGFKRYDEVSIGDRILAFDIDQNEVVEDSVQDIIVSNEETEVIMFKSPTFDSASTLNHRWVVCESDESPRIKYTQNIYNNRWPDYPILRVADNSLSGIDWSDDYIHLLGWIMTDGSYSSQYYGIQLFQTTRREKNAAIYYAMIDLLGRLGIEYTDTCSDGYYHTIYLKKTEWLYKVFTEFSSRTLTFDFVSTLSQHQCEILMWAMIEGDGTLGDDGSNITFTCNTVQRRDVFQYIAFRAGYATNSYTTTAEQANRWTNGKIYDSLTNKNPVNVRHDYYTISVLRFKRAQIYPHHKSKYVVPGVWCVTTNTHTWVARRNGKVYITGNSVVQGSAADMTKMAILNLENNEEWKKLGGRLLVPVHDELVAEVPYDNLEEGEKVLAKLMIDAADFLPFSMKCDVETSYRWYGLEAPCPYKKATSIDTQDEEEIKWLQYHLVEMEYLLPVIKDESGEARGNAAYGVNGIRTDEMEKAIFDYMSTRSISSDEFIDRIEQEVSLGY